MLYMHSITYRPIALEYNIGDDVHYNQQIYILFTLVYEMYVNHDS